LQDPCLGLGEIGHVATTLIESVAEVITTFMESLCYLVDSFTNAACWRVASTTVDGACGILDTVANTKVGVAVLENVCGLSDVLSSCLNYCFRDFAWRSLDIICTHLECTAAAPCPCLWPTMCISQLASIFGIVLGSVLLPGPL
jgi:hypothetical protein